MTQYEERHLTALQQIGYQLENLNRNISKFGFTVLPTQDHDNSLCGNVNDCELVATLRKIIENRNDAIDEIAKENEHYRKKIQAYEKQIKELIEGPEPAKEIYRGMEVAQFGAK